ncbi:hypothetical protein R6Q57_007561 [Mikania cordata]
MEGETAITSDVPVTEVNKETAEEMNKDVKQDEKDAPLDGEFIVEKETVDVKNGGSQTSPLLPFEDNMQSIIAKSREVLEANEKTNKLELEVEKLTTNFKHLESENAELKNQVCITREKLDQKERKYEDLEINHQKLQDLFKETKERYNSQISALQEELQAQESNQKEMVKVKESFEALNIELDSSRKRTNDLEQELVLSASDAKKFKELHKQSESLVESETNRVLELERLLQLAQVGAKEMEDQMALVQEELKGLYEKVANHENVEEALKKTTIDLSVFQEELEVSKSQVLEIQKKHASQEANLSELTEELIQKKASESSTQENLQAKESELEEVKLKLHEIQEELPEIRKEKEAVDAILVKSKIELAETKERAYQLSSNYDTLLAEYQNSQAKHKELEQELKLLKAALEETKSLEAKLEEELAQFSVKMPELTSTIATLEEEKKHLNQLLQDFIDKVTQLESELTQSSSRNTVLELELKTVLEKLTDHQERANMSHQRSIELEDTVQNYNLKAQNADKKASELELLWEAEKYRIQDLEEQIKTLEKQCMDTEECSRNHSQKASELEAEIEALRSKATVLEGALEIASKKELELTESLEGTLKIATKKEQELIESLDLATAEKKQLENISRKSSEQLVEAENFVETLRNELKVSQQKLETIMGDLEASGIRETKVINKLKLAEEQLDEARSKHLKYETLHETQTREFDLKLQESVAEFASRDTEAKSLLEKSMTLETQLAEATEKTNSLKDEIDQLLLMRINLENKNERLKKEMEDQMALVQEELKGLSDKVVDHEKVEEALKKTTVDLSVVQDELEA